jgi:hypothetical protein
MAVCGYAETFPSIHPEKEGVARCWWFVPVILATWETEIRRIEV